MSGVYAGNPLCTTDATRKDAIIALVEAGATEGGAVISAAASPVVGPLSLDHIRNALGINTTEAARLVSELVDSEDIAVVKDGDSQPNSWRYEPAGE